MIFKTLEERFNANVSKIYNQYSNGTLVEFKPNDPSRDNVDSDSREIPIGSTARDLTRIGKFLVSGNGIRFLAEQQLLQTGNAISETRQINPLFVLENVPPYIHARRSLRTQQGEQLTDPSRSPASDSTLGKEGRLQKETAKRATSVAIGSSPSSVAFNLLNLFAPSELISVITNTISLGDGTLGVNERPELNVNGTMYSVLMWKGWQSAVAKYLVPIQQAIASAGAVVNTVPILNQITSIFTELGLNAGQTIQPENNQLYFITDQNNAIKYMSKYTAMDRDPVLVAADILSSFSQPQAASALSNMTYPDLAIENRYSTDDRLDFLRTHLDDQISNAKQDPSIYHIRGIGGGIYPDNLPDHAVESDTNFQSFAFSVSGSYFDKMNDQRWALVSGSVLPSPTEGFPQDYISVKFYDTVNNITIPLRSSIRRITENVSPAYVDEKYIGRLERNVVYSGASRKLVVGMWIVAFSPNELDTIWKRINYLTGLAFPSKYTSDGYMVPNFVKLTIGNYYSEQPGYISALTSNITEIASWVVDEGSQVPRHIELDFSFDVIEKEAMVSSSPFYGFGTLQNP